MDNEDRKTFFNRHEVRIKKQGHLSNPSSLIRVVIIIVILALTIGVAYFLFAVFSTAPEPAKVDEPEIQPTSQEVVEEPVPEEAPEPVVEETPMTVAVYNAGDTAGAAGALAAELAAQGIQAAVGGNITYIDGAGLVILDLTSGQKPKAAEKLTELYKVAPVAATVLPDGVQPGVDFVIIIQ
jgi:hypothetical protein